MRFAGRSWAEHPQLRRSPGFCQGSERSRSVVRPHTTMAFPGIGLIPGISPSAKSQHTPAAGDLIIVSLALHRSTRRRAAASLAGHFKNPAAIYISCFPFPRVFILSPLTKVLPSRDVSGRFSSLRPRCLLGGGGGGCVSRRLAARQRERPVGTLRNMQVPFPGLGQFLQCLMFIL